VIPHLCNFDRENDKAPVDGMGYIFDFQTNPYGFHENQTIGYCTRQQKIRIDNLSQSSLGVYMSGV